MKTAAFLRNIKVFRIEVYSVRISCRASSEYVIVIVGIQNTLAVVDLVVSTAKKAMEITGIKRTTFYKLVGEKLCTPLYGRG